MKTPQQAQCRRDRRFLHTSPMAGGGEYNTRKGNKPAHLVVGFHPPATSAGCEKPVLWRSSTPNMRLAMTRSTGRKPRPKSAHSFASTGPVFTHLVCAIALTLHRRAAWVGPNEFIIRTNRAELEALRFSAECAKSFSEKG